ncbi:glucosyltransferase domain-containing protein [Halomonas sp. QX-2]|jgi:hypothetical protein|uniref:Glucosyltransferase domain-containing protein n=1 Tax=Vreelandella sedimenti TaxID=2729618 RepID=A0A7Z0NAT2_9GAMM|nr:glucosyltransferase domain-containing protein [Halomonas sedimenti]NYT74329.1 glucosyltransferase domain-containing protein [Halomonas sedimenti]
MLSFYRNILSKITSSASGYAWLYLLVVIAYAYQAIIPTFNSDDIIQIQSISQDARTFLAQGRWGYFMVFEWLQDNNPGGLFYSAIGSMLLLWSSWFAARIIGFSHGAAIYSFMLASSISIYYGMLFDFSSTRVAYPLANLCALAGLYAIYKGRYGIGMAILVLAPALYPAAAQVAGVVLICAFIMSIITQNLSIAIKRFLIGTTALIISLILYFLITSISYRFIGIEPSSRMSISPFALIENAEIIKSLFLSHSLSFITLPETLYITLRWTLPLLGIFITFAITCMLLIWRRKADAVIVILLVILSLFAPFALAFAGSNTPFPPRSLIGLASLHAFWVAFVIDKICFNNINQHFAAVALICAGTFSTLFLFDSASQINKFAYDKYLATQADLLATNRIIGRIESTAAELERPLATPQSIAVIYEIPMASGPRGDAGTARFAPWSREWIFRIVDSRFIPANEAERLAAVNAAANRESWPSNESVFFIDDVAVVIINQQDTQP